jgi:hypothetical protein
MVVDRVESFISNARVSEKLRPLTAPNHSCSGFQVFACVCTFQFSGGLMEADTPVISDTNFILFTCT